MYLRKSTFLFLVAVCVTINAVAAKRRPVRTKVKKTSIQNIVAPPCSSQKPLDVNCGCRGPCSCNEYQILPCGCQGSCSCPGIPVPSCGCQGSVIEPSLGPLRPLEIAVPSYQKNCGCRNSIIEQTLGTYTPVEIAIPYQNPVIDIPNYRYADPLELSPLGSLFPSIDIPNYSILSAPIVEYFDAVDLPCGCPGPKCGCRAPAVKLPTCPREFLPAIEVPSCGYQGLPIPAYSYGSISQVIELPSYPPVVQVPLAPACNCLGSCSCPNLPISSCSCQGPCSCSSLPSTCNCQRACSCPTLPISLCDCQGPCSCTSLSSSPCICQGLCSCNEYQILPCGCQSSCSCPGIPVSSCACQGPCGCAATPCGCQGACSCPSIPSMPVGLLPAIEVPTCGCGCGLPGCNCGKYLRQVTIQPPFL